MALETSGNLCSCAVVGFKQQAFLTSQPGERHTEVLLGLVQKAMQQAQGQLKDLDAIAYSAGPGAFTGLRVGCGIAQGLGWALEKKLLPIGTLYALAYAVQDKMPVANNILAATDARMHECYTAIYQKSSDDFVEIRSPLLVKPEDLEKELVDHAAHYACGNAFRLYDPTIPKDVKVLSTEDCNAQMLIAPALKEYREGNFASPDKPVLIYVRNHVAQTIAERKKKGTQHNEST
ncbi:MAG: tRNA (adenosine(37)-N6)-threonylcarbamoyltransferase complex dimerization subunit type 1 TsaB [Burkholderiales bacterium]|nr:tRNA (adenosine(37)-N6)-threonylcarbamoyltransferase complex dimerization subunit type 1 TsaB [Burkholderiales bacterium]